MNWTLSLFIGFYDLHYVMCSLVGTMIFNTLLKCIKMLLQYPRNVLYWLSDTEYKTTSQNDIAFILFSVKKGLSLCLNNFV